MIADAPTPIALDRLTGSPAGIADAGGRVVYAIGDVHGCYELARALLAGIAADIGRLSPAADPVLLFVGDYVDRGPRSADVVAMLLWLERQAPCEVVLLKGNHEAMLFDFIADPRAASGWLELGGMATLASYGVEWPGGIPSGEACVALRDALLDRLPAAHLELLRRLSLRCRIGDYVFVHAGLRPGVALERQREDDCLWIRDAFLSAPPVEGIVVVHGHSWSGAEPVEAAGRIGIDTGAYETGALTAVRLDGESVSFLRATAGAAAPPSAAAALELAGAER